MKKIAFWISLCIVTALFFPVLALAAGEGEVDFSAILDDHGAVMLLVEPESGAILYANHAAAQFYEYTKDQLTAMNLSQLNTLTPEQTEEEMQAAVEEKRNFFLFRHRLASGETRTVEVFSYPSRWGDKLVLLSVIHDITEKTLLQERERKLTAGVFFTGLCILVVLLLLISILILHNKSLLAAKKEQEALNELRQTFFDADDNMVYLKDENLKYILVNRAFANFHNRPPEEIIGRDEFDLSDAAFAESRKKSDLAALTQGALVVDETTAFNSRVYRVRKFPVRMQNGKFGVGAHIRDITEEHAHARSQERALKRNKILLEVLGRSFPSMQKQLDFALHELLELSKSQYGYIYLYDEKKKEFILNSWTKGVMEECRVEGQPKRYQLANTGIWGEVVRQRKPIVVNDFAAFNPLKKGYPKGHVTLSRFMSVPVFIDDEIVAVVGFGNKATDYDEADVYEMTLLMSGVWNAVRRRDAAEKLAYERNKYLQTLLSIGDGVMVIDQNQKVEMLNTVACQMTGWSLPEAQGRHYKDVFALSHEQEGFTIKDPIQGVFSTREVQELGNHAILTSRDGRQYYLEDSAAPVKGDSGEIGGVVLVFRDVTDKKEQRKKIEYMSFHDSLTGLYNRRFFEEEMLRLDTARNLPISIVMGDVNSLKLTNDIFGHAFGDMLLEKVAEVMQAVCRADDIIARWGGDEFVLLLPRTSEEEAEKIIARIRTEVARQQIRAIRGSISIGCETKTDLSQDIMQVLAGAEERMYSVKTLERDEVRSSAIDALTTTFYESNHNERNHALRVSGLCQEFGRVLGQSEGMIRRLKEAGRLHDIGKIVLEPVLLSPGYLPTPSEQSEIKRHPIVGYRILNSFDGTLDLAELVLAHHERWDGTGYPKGLKGEEIPLPAQIISIAEYYDRITHGIGKTAQSQAEAVSEIRCLGEKRFDPRLTEAFAQMFESRS